MEVLYTGHESPSHTNHMRIMDEGRGAAGSRHADRAWSQLHLPMSGVRGARPIAGTDANVSRPAKHCIMPSEKGPSQSAVNRISDRQWHTLSCRGEGSSDVHRDGRRDEHKPEGWSSEGFCV